MRLMPPVSAAIRSYKAYKIHRNPALLLTAAFLSLTIQAQDKSSEQLSIRVASNKAQYFIGEPVYLTGELTNNMARDTTYHPYAVTVFYGKAGHKLQRAPHYLPAGIPPTSMVYPPMLLKAGSSIHFAPRLFYRTGANAVWPDEAGEFQIALGIDTYDDSKKSYYCVQSKPIRIVVVAPYGQDLSAWQSLGDRNIKWLLPFPDVGILSSPSGSEAMKKLRAAEQYIRDFRDSYYAERVRLGLALCYLSAQGIADISKAERYAEAVKCKDQEYNYMLYQGYSQCISKSAERSMPESHKRDVIVKKLKAYDTVLSLSSNRDFGYFRIEMDWQEGVGPLNEAIKAMMPPRYVAEADAFSFKLLQRVKPALPRKSNGTIPKGYVGMTIQVGPTGNVEEIHVNYCSDPTFKGPSMEAISKWKYTPARDKNGNPVYVGLNIALQFPDDADIKE